MKKRDEEDSYNMVRELAVDDRKMYFRYMGMTPDRKEYLLSLGAPLITKLSTNNREPIPPEQRLSLTLRHLVTGESQISLSLQFRIGRQTISKIISKTCKAIYDAIVAKYVNTPSSQKDWLAISQQFEDRWNIPHILGALDGKHIRIQLYFTISRLFRHGFARSL